MGNIKTRTPNTWIHELTPQTLVLRLRYLWVHLARTNIQSNSRWTYLSEILIFGLDSTVSVFSRLLPFSGSKTTNTHHDDDLIPRQLDWAQLRRDWLEKKTSAILDSHSTGMRRSFAQIYYWTRFLECFFEKVLWGVVSLMTTRTVLVLATVVSIRDKFFYPCCARCHKKVYFRDAEATMWVRLFDCFEMQQHYTRSLNVKFYVAAGYF